MKKLKNIFAVIVCAVVASVSSASTVCAIKIDSSVTARAKLSSDLLTLVDGKSNKTVTVCIFRDLLSDDEIDVKLPGGTSAGTQVQIKTGSKVTKSESPSKAAVPSPNVTSEVMAGYVSSFRESASKKYAGMNSLFIHDNGISKDSIVYIGKYTSTLIVRATPKDVLKYAAAKDVVKICLFENSELIPETDTVPGLLNADSAKGTKSKKYNAGKGYTGKGVVIGVIEANSGTFDPSSPSLKGIPSSQLSYIENRNVDGKIISPSVTDHATRVVSILIGKKVKGGFEGMAPDAEVIVTSANSPYDLFNAFNLLAENGANVINISAGISSDGYNFVDWEIDRLVQSTKVTLVKSAGNSGGNITSPGNGLNVITVGNIDAKTSGGKVRKPPYSLEVSSAFSEHDYFPNKPDVVAPGTNIAFAYNGGTEYGTGTSYSSPFIAGFIAQLMQRVPNLAGNPYRVKSLVINFSSNSDISSSDNPKAGSDYLLDKSGAGLPDALQITKAFSHANGVIKKEKSSVTYGSVTYKKGQKVRIVLVYFKDNPLIINSENDVDNLDLMVVNQSGTTVAKSCSTRNNVEIIEFTVPKDGKYSFRVFAQKINPGSDGIYYGISYRVIS